MNKFFMALIAAFSLPTFATPTVFVAKDEHAAGRPCELKALVMHSKGSALINQVGNRLMLELRKPQRGAYYDCPASVSVPVDSRAEAMKLYELVHAARKVVCHSSMVVSGSHVNLTCDTSFEIRDEH